MSTEETSSKQQASKDAPKNEAPPPTNEIPKEEKASPKKEGDASPPSKKSTGIKDLIYWVESFLKISYFITYFFVPTYATIIAGVVCLLALARQGGVPKWSKEYAAKVFKNEFMHNLWYILAFALFAASQRSNIFFLPLAVHFWVGLCEFLNLKLPFLVAKSSYVKTVVDFCRGYRHIFLREKAKIELYFFFYLIVIAFLGWTSFFILLFYFNYLRIKYMVNDNFQFAIAEIDYFIRMMLNRSWIPKFIPGLYEKVRQLCGWLVKIK